MRAASENSILKCQKVFQTAPCALFLVVVFLLLFLLFRSHSRMLRYLIRHFNFLHHPVTVTTATNKKNCNISIRKLHRINFRAVGTFLRFRRLWLTFALIANICFKFVVVFFWLFPSVFKSVELFDVYFISTSTNSTTRIALSCRAPYHMFKRENIAVVVSFFFFLFFRMILFSCYFIPLFEYRIHYAQAYTIAEIVSWMKRTKEQAKKW